MKFLSSLFGVLLFLLCLIFAYANRQMASISLWPCDMEVNAPLFVLVVGALVLGLLIGGVMIWLNHLPHRFALRRMGKDVVMLGDRVVQLERELEQYRKAEREAAGEAPASTLKLPGSLRRFWKRFS